MNSNRGAQSAAVRWCIDLGLIEDMDVIDLKSVDWLTYSPDGKAVAVGDRDGTVKLWDLETWQVRKPFAQQPRAVRALAFAPDGRALVTVGGEPVRWVRVHPAAGLRGYYVHLARGSSAQAVQLWDVRSRRPLASLPTPQDVELYSLAWSPDGRAVAAGGAGGTLWLWDAAKREGRPPRFTSEPARAYWNVVQGLIDVNIPVGPHFTEHVLSVAFDPAGKVLATVNERGNLQLWDAASGEQRALVPGERKQRACVAFAPDGRLLACNNGPAVEVWEVAGPGGEALERPALRHRLSGPAGVAVRCLAWSPDGRALAAGGADWCVRLWDVAGGREKAELRGHTDAVFSVAFAPSGKTVATGGGDGAVKLWQAASGQELATLEGHSGKVLSVAFAPDGKTLATGGEAADGSGEVYLWSAASPRGE
jgi:WD40 repeat protein